MFFKVQINILCFYLIQLRLCLLNGYITVFTIPNAVTNRAERLFRFIHLTGKRITKLYCFDAGHVRNDCRATSLESKILTDFMDCSNIICQRIDLLHCKTEVIQLRRSIKTSLIVAELISYVLASLLQLIYSCRRHQCLPPKGEILAKFRISNYGCIAICLSFFQKLFYTLCACSLIIKQSRINIQYSKQCL